MNYLIIIGNLTREPETRVTQSGISVCSFTVAVNRRKIAGGGDPGADFFRVTAWRQLGENCQKYLQKGRKVCVVGTVSASAYTDKNGKAAASLEVTAENVEFLSQRSEDGQAQGAGTGTGTTTAGNAGGFSMVQEEDLPF